MVLKIVYFLLVLALFPTPPSHAETLRQQLIRELLEEPPEPIYEKQHDYQAEYAEQILYSETSSPYGIASKAIAGAILGRKSSAE